MNYKKYLLIFILFASCSSIERIEPISKNQILRDSFKSNGFTLLFNDSLKNDKIVSKKIDERSLTIFQNNLKKGTSVKITNLLNNKSLIAKVGDDINYPSFFKRVTGTKAVKVGWHTDKSSRGLLWYDLIDAVQSGAVSVPNRQGLEQFYSVIRDPTRSHRPEAMEGAHDDYPMAVAIALQAASQSFRRRAPRVVEGFNTNVLAFADYHRRF